MHFVYLLYSPSHGAFYVGSTADPDQRLASHNAGKVASTKAKRPWYRVLLETYPDRASAQRREKYLKSGWGRRVWKRQLLQEGWPSGLWLQS